MYRYGQARTSPTPPLTHLRFDGILLCEANGRCRDKGATGTEWSHFSQLLVWPIFNLPMCNKLSFFISCCVYDEYAVMTICWGGFCPFRFLLLQMHDAYSFVMIADKDFL